MIATIGRMTTVTSATFSRHIAKAQDERKIQSCGVRIAKKGELRAIVRITTTAILWGQCAEIMSIAVSEKGEHYDKYTDTITDYNTR